MKDKILLKIFAFIGVFIIFYIHCVSPVLSATPDLNLSASSAILIDHTRGQVLYGKDPNKKLHISTASKIMTAILVIEKAKLDSKVTISKESASFEGSLLSLEVGEKHTVEDLLYAILLTSANDATNALAEYVGGDSRKFVEMMNGKCRELNLKNTNFTNSTGLFDDNQYTTANDIAMLTRYAISNDIFARIFSTKARPWIRQNGTTILVNSNKLFWSYDGIEGGKTGYNDKERQSAVTVAKRNDLKLIAIVSDSPGDKLFEDSVKLLDYGFSNFRTGVLVQADQALKSIMIQGQEVNLVSKKDVYYTFPSGESYIKNIEFKISDKIVPPVTKENEIGVAKYTLSDGTAIDVNLYPDTEIHPPVSAYDQAWQKLKEYKDILILLVFLIAIECILFLTKAVKLVKKLMIRG